MQSLKFSFLKSIAPLLFFANLAVVFSFWLSVSLRVSNLLISLGTLAGLLAAYFALWQLLLIGRVAWIERFWGHDKLSRIHHFLGITTVSVIFFHPILLVLGYSIDSGEAPLSHFLGLLSDYKYILALIAYLLLLSIVFISLWIIRKHLKYEIWYFIHIALYLAIILAFIHQKSGRDFITDLRALYWQALFYLTLANIIYYRFLKPLWQSLNCAFQVVEVKKENDDVVSIIIGGENLEKLEAKAGQFMIFRFLAKNFWRETHPFSLSEAPSGGRLRITIKGIGDFTKKISDLPLGTRVLVEGPLGLFIPERSNKKSSLLIAGGIGITPLRSIFEEFAKTGHAVDLIYSARAERDFVLKNELNLLSNPNAKVHYIETDKTGILTSDIIKKMIPDIIERDVFLCGPPLMMKSVISELKKVGVSKRFIYFERFQLG